MVIKKSCFDWRNKKIINFIEEIEGKKIDPCFETCKVIQIDIQTIQAVIDNADVLGLDEKTIDNFKKDVEIAKKEKRWYVTYCY